MNKQNKGITLIALVITIVILVILVGVSVSAAINTGLVSNSKTAVKDYDKAQTNEKSQLLEVEDLVTGYSSKDIMASKVTPANYGDTVKGYINIDNNENTDDWQIFSVEGNNVWLISKDYVQLDETTLKDVGIKTEEYNVWWKTTPNYKKTYNNGNCAAELADASKWTLYVDDNFALKAMGGPTIEMFVKSYNAKYLTTTIKYELVTTEDNEGYQIKWNTDEDFSSGISGVNTEDNLYVVTDETKAAAYWLASPSIDASNSLMFINYAGDCDGYDCLDWSGGGAVRPVVCLKSNIKFSSSTTDGVTTWTLTK